MCASNVGMVIFRKCILSLTLTGIVDASVVEESKLVIIRPVLKIALEIINFSSASSFASSIVANAPKDVEQLHFKRIDLLVAVLQETAIYAGSGSYSFLSYR